MAPIMPATSPMRSAARDNPVTLVRASSAVPLTEPTKRVEVATRPPTPTTESDSRRVAPVTVITLSAATLAAATAAAV